MISHFDRDAILRPRFAGLLVAGVFLFLLQLAWKRAAHPIIDFGREPYTAWRLSAGDLLYRDVASIFGPFAAYADAAVFALLGPSITVLFALNAVLIAVAVAIVYRFAARVSDHLVALVSALMFLVVFAFDCTEGFSFNFLAPYSQAAVWGVVLGMVCITVLQQWLSAPTDRRWVLVAGLLCGLTLLTKPEIGVAAVGASVCALAIGIARSSARDEGRPGKAVLLLVGGILVPLGLTIAVFGAAGSLTLGIEAVTASFAPIFAASPVGMDFYRQATGLDAPLIHATNTVVATALVLASLGLLGMLDGRLVDRWGDNTECFVRAGILGVVLAVLALGGWLPSLVFETTGRAMPVILVAALAGSGISLHQWRRRSRSSTFPLRAASLAVWIVFSLLLMLKQGFRPRFSFNGFYLAAPGGVALVVILMDVLPGRMRQATGSGALTRLAGMGLIVLTILGHGLFSIRQYRSAEVKVGTGPDALWSSGPLAESVDSTLTRIEGLAAPDATLVVIPEGASINYWSRRRNPTTFTSFMPPELAFYGPGRMRTALARSRPDYVVFWKRPLAAYGGGYFGDSSGRGAGLLKFLRNRYRRVDGIPVEGRPFQFEILKRRSLSGKP